MQTELSHFEQYKMLREEIMQHIRETYRTEFATAIAVGAVYTWLLSNKQTVVAPVIWFIPPLVILLAALRCLFLTIQLRVIAEYLRRIEEATFGEDTRLPGWERYLSGGIQRSFVASSTYTAGAVWVLVFMASIVASWYFAR